MQEISEKQILERARQENPWWTSPQKLSAHNSQWTPRPYLDLLAPLIEQTKIRRAIVLMGPRRVGKTVMIHHMIERLLSKKISPKLICYFSVDHPIYNGLSLESYIKYYSKAVSIDPRKSSCFFFFDEIQYLKDWEKHLKSIVDSYPNIRFVVSGSAAAALKVKSTESGAGRFTDFLLPPLTFHEYLTLLNQTESIQFNESGNSQSIETKDIAKLNEHFINYVNFGGYPEVVFSKEIQSDPGRYIKSDIIDKVLLRDLPQLYGINDIQELNSLFTTLAFNTAGEVSLEGLSKGSGVAKNTIKKYIEYLEAAFLIRVVQRVDKSGKRFKRANFFKSYLTNPSMYAALFSPVKSNDLAMGSLVETAIFSQWFHQENPMHYGRWKNGEVDIVGLTPDLRVDFAVEVKWSNRFYERPYELKSLIEFARKHELDHALVTTKTITGRKEIEGITFIYHPASLYCYILGQNIVQSKSRIGK